MTHGGCLRLRRAEARPPDIKWEKRGWLVMLRARHLASLEKARDGWWRLDFLRRNGSKRRPFSLRGMMGTDAVIHALRDVELGELPTSRWELTRVVANVIEVGEEGIFRHVVMFL